MKIGEHGQKIVKIGENGEKRMKTGKMGEMIENGWGVEGPRDWLMEEDPWGKYIQWYNIWAKDIGTYRPNWPRRQKKYRTPYSWKYTTAWEQPPSFDKIGLQKPSE